MLFFKKKHNPKKRLYCFKQWFWFSLIILQGLLYDRLAAEPRKSNYNNCSNEKTVVKIAYDIEFLNSRARNPHQPLLSLVRYLRRCRQMRRFLELLERRSLQIPVLPWSGLWQRSQGLHVGWPGSRVQERR